MVISVIMVTTT